MGKGRAESAADGSVHGCAALGGWSAPGAPGPRCLSPSVSPRHALPTPLPTQESPLTPWGPHLAVHVGFRPGDVMVVVDDHGPAEHMQVFHHVLLGIRQSGDLRVVACGGEGAYGCGCRACAPPAATALGRAPGWELPWATRHHFSQGCPLPGQPEASGAVGTRRPGPGWTWQNLEAPPAGAAGPQPRARGHPSLPAGLSSGVPAGSSVPGLFSESPTSSFP